MSDSTSAKTPNGDLESDDTVLESSTDLDASGEESDSIEDSFLRAVAQAPATAPPSAEPDRVGTELAKYKIVDELGRGGMGIVYAAEDIKLRRRVALKVLPQRFALDPERRQRFLREARAASAITHRNIATVFDVDEAADGSVYIAMELVEGRTLREQLKDGPLPVADALRISREVLHGLAKAHETGIVHRDLKPDNVMVTKEGAVKLLDFGLAKPIGTREAALREESVTSSDVATMAGRVLGTPSYMSPEQAKGRPVDERSDIFSFGVLLFEMLSAERPFTADGTVALLIAIDRDAPAPLSQAPRWLERIVQRCLEKKPEQRFSNCAELLALLDQKPRRSSRSTAFAVVASVFLAGAIGWWLFRASAPATLGAASAEPVATPPRQPTSVGANPTVRPTAPVPAPSASATSGHPPSRKPPIAPGKPTRDPLADQK